MLLLCLCLLAPASAAAQLRQFDDDTYRDCMRAAERTPADAFETAMAWKTGGGGEAAEHCAAVALLGLGQTAEAANRLEQLGVRLTAYDRKVAVQVLRQAGQAWQLADQPQRAEAVQNTALELAPGDPELLIDRAISMAQQSLLEAAVQDLNTVLVDNPMRADALVLRATAQRRLGDIDAAWEDADTAVASDPSFADAWLEHGNLNMLLGRPDAARDDWVQAVTLAPPDSVTAANARENLERLDVEAKE
jgi:tetratricopeptide (TPR) repeat protein